MDSMPFLFYLRKVLPDINVMNPVIQQIVHSDLNPEDKILAMLSHHFKSRRSKYIYHSHQSHLSADAKLIHKLFPSYDFLDIVDKLNCFVDMPNRNEIVLRIISLANETPNPPMKRPSLQYLDSVNNNQPMSKIRKMEEPVEEKTVRGHPGPSSTMADRNSGMFVQDKPATVTSCTIQDGNKVPFSFAGVATVTSAPFSTVEVPNHDHAYLRRAKPATVTSSDVEKAVIKEHNEPSSTSTVISSSYEIPDIMEHFDLPLVNLQLPGVADVQLPFVKEETVESTTGAELVTNSGNGDVVISSDAASAESLSHGGEVTSEASSEVPRDSQDSGKTEVYSLDEEVVDNSAIPETSESRHTVTVVSPTRIRIKMGLGCEREKQAEEGKENVAKKDETFNMPSTSRQNSAMNNRNGNFDLVHYIREITNAKEEVIRTHCRKLNLHLNSKPMPYLLNVLIDNVLYNVVDSNNTEDSDDSEVENLANVNAEQESVIICEPNPEPTSSNENAEATDEDANIDKQLVQHLCLIFTDACPKYIKGLCRGKVNNNEVLDNLVTQILSTNSRYPKRPRPSPEPEVVPENQLEILNEFLPDADPDYLSMMLDKFEGKPDLVKTFLNEAMERRNYPTLKDYQRRQQLSAQQKQYTTEFNVENFTKLIPDPHSFFNDPSRKLKINNTDSHYILVFMRNKFNRIQVRAIQNAFQKNKGDIRTTIRDLEKLMTQNHYTMKSTRKPIEMPNNIENIPLLQELAYYTHKDEIDFYLKQKSQKEKAEREEAISKGLIKTCNCCYDEEVLPRDIYRCESGCEFCKSCIVKSSEVLFGEGKLAFPCLMNCSSSFTLQTLQAVLSPKLFSKIAQKKALEEIKAAGIEELEVCPFCDFATIPAEGYNIFTCMNPECMKESCRMCKEPSHIPLRCDEIEKDADVRARTFVEDKMTEALLKKCWKCGVKFFKEEGCNKMTCSCGAQMCYVCGKPVESYKHFNGNGGDRFDLCPLYSDTNVLNKENVLKGAEAAKAEIGNVNLKYDPTADLNKHYQDRRGMFPQNHLQPPQLPAPPVFPNPPRPPVNMLLPAVQIPLQPPNALPRIRNLIAAQRQRLQRYERMLDQQRFLGPPPEYPPMDYQYPYRNR